MLLNWPTSEYKLEYKNLPAELRKKIWEDNLKFREFLAENNRIQHFWYHQTLQSGQKNEKPESQDSSAYQSDTTDARHQFQEVHTRDRATRQKDTQYRETPTRLKSALKNQTKDVVEPYCSFQAVTDRKLKEVAIQTPVWHKPTNSRVPADSKTRKLWMEPYFSSYLSPTPERKINSKTAIVHKKAHDPQHQLPPFMSYGWNDCKKDIGSKRTFNVKASSHEIYPSTLHAISRKRELQKKADALRPPRPSTAPLVCPVNHTSLWMTEYQDTFSKPRPQSAPFAMKSVRWQ